MYIKMVPAAFTLAVVLVPTISSSTKQECVPPDPASFFYDADCEGFSNRQVYVKKIVATQDGTIIEKRGGIDCTKPLILSFNITYNGKPLKKHLLDQEMYEYVPGVDGKCHWKLVELDNMMKDIDMCTLLFNVPCDYHNHPTFLVCKLDYYKMFGDAVSGMIVGRYYKFKNIERDGDTKIGCFWVGAKVIKAE